MYHRESSKTFRFRKWEGSLNLKTLYKAYYAITDKLKPPTEIERREFAFQLFDFESYVRHISFSSFKSLREYLESNAPRHVYYSTALYQLPEAKSMEEKGWLGSELLIDIDVDHLRNCNPIRAAGSLVDDKCLIEGFKAVSRIKRILYRDLGISSWAYFSGSRGFHIIGYCDYCLTLGKEERGEIASYIVGASLEIEYLIPLKAGKGVPVVPTSEDPGWRGYIGEALREKGLKDALKNIERSYLEGLVEELGVPVDMQVTRDPTRLARLIGSINGKSSLLVVDVGEEFKPTIDLSPFRGFLTVKAEASLEDVRLLGLRVEFKTGEVLELEAPLALLLASQGLVTPISGEVWVE